MTAINTIRCALLPCLLLPGLASADIREIPAAEMTEAYIRDSTVIIPQQKTTPEREKKSLNVRVSPADEAYREGESLRPATESLSTTGNPADDNLAERNSAALDSLQTYDFSPPLLDPAQAGRDAILRELLALDPATPIDYSSLQFPTTVSTDIPPPAGTSYDITPGQFSISIPNSNNYPSDSYVTPGGEYQVDVTPSDITFTISLPQNQ